MNNQREMNSKGADHFNLINNITRYYNFGQVKKYWFSKYGYESKVLLVISSAGQFAIKIYQNKTLEDLQEEIEITECLTTHSFPAPKLVRTKGSKPYAVDQDLIFVAFDFVEGYHLRAKHIQETTAFQLGNMLGRFHSLFTNHDVSSRIKKQTRGVTYIHKVHELLTTYSPGNEQIDRYKGIFFREYLKLEPYFPLLAELPQGIIHSDLSMDNILFHKDGITFIDFGDSGHGFFIIDLAILILGIAINLKGIDIPLFKAIIAGYQRVIPLSQRELAGFYQIIHITCLRKAATYFNYYINRNCIIFKNIGYLEKLKVLSAANNAEMIHIALETI